MSISFWVYNLYVGVYSFRGMVFIWVSISFGGMVLIWVSISFGGMVLIWVYGLYQIQLSPILYLYIAIVHVSIERILSDEHSIDL